MNRYGDIGNPLAGWYFRQLLPYMAAVVVLERFLAVYRIPANQTRVGQWRRPVPFPAALVPLSEGVTPSPTHMSYESIEVQLQQFGAYVPVTDWIQDFTKNRVVRDAAELQGNQIAQTSEAIRWGVVKNGTSVHLGGSPAATARSALTKGQVFTVAMQDRITTRLMRNKAMMLEQILPPGPEFGTFGIEASYIGFSHTDLVPTLRNLARFSGDARTDSTSFLPVARYGSRKMASKHEKGSFDDVRYIVSPDLEPYRGAGGAIQAGDKPEWYNTGDRYDVYPILVIGQEYAATVTLRPPRRGMRSATEPGVTPTVLQPGVPRGGDPLGQRGSIGWKMYMACEVLQDAWGDRAEVVVKVAGV